MTQFNTIAWSTMMAVVLLAMMVPATPSLAVKAQQNASDDDPPESLIARHYSLYYENFQNENFARVTNDLEWILENAPGFPHDDDRNFRRAVRTYEALADQADGDERSEHLARALELYMTSQERMEELGISFQPFWWKRERGRFLQIFEPYLDDPPMTHVDAYKEAFDEDPERMDMYFIDMIIQDYLDQDDRQGALDFMDHLEELRGHEDEIRQTITDTRDELFDSPEERYDFLTTRIEEEPDNVDLIREKFDIAQNMGYRSDMFELADRLLELEPNATSFFEVGMMYLDDGEEERALTYFERALDQPDVETGNLQRDIYFNMGVAERRQNRFPQARTNFRRALEQDRNFGQAFMEMGNLYASAVSDCSGASLETEDRAVYWLVVDYYERARQADSNLASRARQLITTYEQLFPTRDTIFFEGPRRGWEIGGTVSIDSGCYSWINESTTIRAAPRS